jgi:hypothetical protein
MLTRRAFLLTASDMGVPAPNARTMREACKNRFQGITKASDLMKIRGMLFSKSKDYLTISCPFYSYDFDITIPDLHYRVKEAVCLFLSKKKVALEARCDLPYRSIRQQAFDVSGEIPLSDPECHKVLKDLREGPMSYTTKDFGPAFNGETTLGEQVYIRVETVDVDEILRLRFRWPQGLLTELDGGFAFVFGRYPGAAEGLCPPLPEELFRSAVDPYDPTVERLKTLGQEYRAVCDEKQPEATEEDNPQLKLVRNINMWLNKNENGHLFSLGANGEFTRAAGFMKGHNKHDLFRKFLQGVPKNIMRPREDALLKYLHMLNDKHNGQVPAVKVLHACLQVSRLGTTEDKKGEYDYSIFLYMLLDIAMRVYFIRNGTYMAQDVRVIRKAGAFKPSFAWEKMDI